MLAVIFLLITSLGLAQSSSLHYSPLNPGAIPITAAWTVANSGANFSITPPVGNATTVAKATGALTQSVTLFALPAKSMLLGCVIKTGTQFAGLTTLTATVGITGTLTACVSTPFDLMAAVSATNFSVVIPTTPVISYAGTNAILALTGTGIGKFLSDISAGSVTVILYYAVVPLP